MPDGYRYMLQSPECHLTNRQPRRNRVEKSQEGSLLALLSNLSIMIMMVALPWSAQGLLVDSEGILDVLALARSSGANGSIEDRQEE
jgi:hypothetical protein